MLTAYLKESGEIPEAFRASGAGSSPSLVHIQGPGRGVPALLTHPAPLAWRISNSPREERPSTAGEAPISQSISSPCR